MPQENTLITRDGKVIALNPQGYLLDPADWNEEVARLIAASENIALTDEVWEIIHYIRDSINQTQCVPELRSLLKYLRKKHGKEKATRRYVYSLFPYGYGQQACKIAGTRIPLKLLLDL